MRIGAGLPWIPQKFRLQLQFFSWCCVGISPFCYRFYLFRISYAIISSPMVVFIISVPLGGLEVFGGPLGDPSRRTTFPSETLSPVAPHRVAPISLSLSLYLSHSLTLSHTLSTHTLIFVLPWFCKPWLEILSQAGLKGGGGGLCVKNNKVLLSPKSLQHQRNDNNELSFPVQRARRGILKPRKPWSANRELRVSKERVVETGVKSDRKKAHRPWIRGKNSAQTLN